MYRGKDALKSLREDEGFGLSELKEVVFRARKSERWKSYLESELGLYGNWSEFPYSPEAPEYHAPPAEAIEFMRAFVAHFNVTRHHDVVLSTSSCSLYIDTPRLSGTGMIKAEPAYRVVHPFLFDDGKEFEDTERAVDHLIDENYIEDTWNDCFGGGSADLLSPWLNWQSIVDDRIDYRRLQEIIQSTYHCMGSGGFLVAWLPVDFTKRLGKIEHEELCLKAIYVLPNKRSFGFVKEAGLFVFTKGKPSRRCYISPIPNTEQGLIQSFKAWSAPQDSEVLSDEWIDLTKFIGDYSFFVEWPKLKKRLIRQGFKFVPALDVVELKTDTTEEKYEATIRIHSETWHFKSPLLGMFHALWSTQSKDGRLVARQLMILPIEESHFAVPDFAVQLRALRNWDGVYQLKNRIAALESQMWACTPEVNSVIDSYSALENVEQFPHRLPWPLSSILRAAFVENNVRLKADRLNYFFEATAEFLAALLLSLIWHNDDLKHGFQRQLNEQLGKRGIYAKPTMGVWVRLFSTIQRFLRKEVHRLGGDASGLWMKLGGVEADFINYLLKKDLHKILEEALTGRNDRAHWGALGETEFQELHERLEKCLKDFDALSGYIFDRNPIVTPVPGSMNFLTSGKFEVVVRKLGGASESFERTKISTNHPLRTDGVFLHTPGVQELVQILPVIHIDKANVCHFYNRVEEGKLKYVSYQADLETNTSLREFSAEMKELLNYLESQA